MSRWIGGEVLCKEFHDLYSMSVRKDVKVADMDNWNGMVWNWNLQVSNSVLSNLEMQ